MKIAVVGSRDIVDFDISPYLPTNCTLMIRGGAKGIDTLAEQYAEHHGIPTLIIRPDYDHYGRSAPIRRNEMIVDNADIVIAFWNGSSRGTKYTIDYARKKSKPTRTYLCQRT